MSMFQIIYTQYSSILVPNSHYDGTSEKMFEAWCTLKVRILKTVTPPLELQEQGKKNRSPMQIGQILALSCRDNHLGDNCSGPIIRVLE